jgi:hypothetical protein
MFLVIGSKKVTSQVNNFLKTPQAEKIFSHKNWCLRHALGEIGI